MQKTAMCGKSTLIWLLVLCYGVPNNHISVLQVKLLSLNKISFLVFDNCLCCFFKIYAFIISVYSIFILLFVQLTFTLSTAYYNRVFAYFYLLTRHVKEPPDNGEAP